MVSHSYERWMSEIPNKMNLSKISIPGTHNSACHFKISAPAVRCQGTSLEEQLVNGVRFLDISVSKDFMARGSSVDELIIVNGKLPVKLSGSYKLRTALDVVYNFLENHPSETVLVAIKQEGTLLNWDYDNDELAKVLFERYIGRNRMKWYISSIIPSLKCSRGKIVLVRRFPVNPDGKYRHFGIPSIWNFNDGVYENSSCCIQNYSVIKNEADINVKIDLIKTMFEKSKEYHQENQHPKFFLNFCTGANVFNRSCWPSNVDDKIRKNMIHEYYHNRCGIVVFDFAEKDRWNLVRRLVDVNYC